MTSTSSPDATAAASSHQIQTVPVTVDTKGRVRASKEQRRVILAEFERSGVSAARFAKQTGLKYSTLAGWLQRYRRSIKGSVSNIITWKIDKMEEERHSPGMTRKFRLQCKGQAWEIGIKGCVKPKNR
jgi:lambda repressor-like predicted transcriptional regulator